MSVEVPGEDERAELEVVARTVELHGTAGMLPQGAPPSPLVLRASSTDRNLSCSGSIVPHRSPTIPKTLKQLKAPQPMKPWRQ